MRFPKYILITLLVALDFFLASTPADLGVNFSSNELLLYIFIQYITSSILKKTAFRVNVNLNFIPFNAEAFTLSFSSKDSRKRFFKTFLLKRHFG